MNIGKLDRQVTVFTRGKTQTDFGSYKIATGTSLGVAWVRKLPKKSDMTSKGGSVMINENMLEFTARYNTSLWKAGHYFTISGNDNDKYWVRGVEEIGRGIGFKIKAELDKSRSV